MERWEETREREREKSLGEIRGAQEEREERRTAALSIDDVAKLSSERKS